MAQLLAAPPYNEYAPIGFDMSRSELLSRPTPQFTPAVERARSTTKSKYRLRWNHLLPWNGFEAAVVNYWNALPQNDKFAAVTSRFNHSFAVQTIANDTRIASEGDIRFCMNTYAVYVHAAAANGLNGAPLPTPPDIHSTLRRYENGGDLLGVTGIPDFVMNSNTGRYTAMVEVKNPWLVTPATIESVRNGTYLYKPR